MNIDQHIDLIHSRATVSGGGRQYLTVSAHSLDRLAERVNELVAVGYAPCGEMAAATNQEDIACYTPYRATITQYIQPMLWAGEGEPPEPWPKPMPIRVELPSGERMVNGWTPFYGARPEYGEPDHMAVFLRDGSRVETSGEDAVRARGQIEAAGYEVPIRL